MSDRRSWNVRGAECDGEKLEGILLPANEAALVKGWLTPATYRVLLLIDPLGFFFSSYHS